jgi:glycosyltransferase involved in cell wall biosynthesis
MILGFDGKRFFHNKTGLGNYSRDLVRILAHFYPDNKYLVYNPKPKKIDRVAIDGKIIIEKLPSKKTNQKLPSLWRSFNINNDIKADNVEIFHGLSGEIPFTIHKTGIKTVVTIHDLIFIRYPELYSFFDRKIHFKKMKYAAENADVVVAISEQTKQDVVEFLGINPEKIIVIHQGCAAVFKENITPDFITKTRLKYNLPDKYLLNVGTIEKRKNILSVVKTLDAIDIPLVIIGKKTAYYEEIEKYIQESNLEGKVIFLENVALQELAAIYKSATIFVYPSIFEGFGIPIIEALYSKIPVITSTGSCFSEAGGSHTVYVNPHNSDEIKTEIINLLANPERRKMMIEKGFEHAQNFNDAVVAHKYMAVYQSLLTDHQ